MDIHPPHAIRSWKDFERFRDQIISLRGILLIEEQMATAATARYKKALE